MILVRKMVILPKFLYAKSHSRLEKSNKFVEAGTFLDAATKGMGILAQDLAFGTRGVSVDRKKAFKVADMAAEDGDAVGQFILARCYHYGWGTDIDWVNALECYGLCKVDYPGYSFNNVGNIWYEGGYGVKQNKKKAKEFFKESAEVGKLFSISELLSNYCLLHVNHSPFQL